MSSIPIIYTGANSAKFDFKSMGQSMRDSYRRIHENAVSQQRYNDIQAQRQQQMLMKEMDVDRINFGNEQVQAIEANMYDDFVNKTANLVAEKKGNLNTQDYLLVKTMANKYERDMSAYKQSEERRIKDYAVATDRKNLSTFDKEKVKENIAYWDYRNGMYPTDALDRSLRELTEEELIQKDARDSKNADYIATYVVNDDKLSGDEYQTKVKEEYEKKFYERVPDKNGNTVTALKAEPSVQFMKDRYGMGGRENDFAAIDKKFQQQSPAKQLEYLNKWGDDAQIAWWTLDDPNRTGQLFPLVTQTSQVKASESGGSGGGGTKTDKRATLDLRNTTSGSMASDPVPFTGPITFINKDGKEETVNAGFNDIRLTKIAKEDGKWYVYGVYKRGQTEEDIEEGVFSRTVQEPIKVKYSDVKEDIERNYNVLLSVEKEDKTQTIKQSDIASKAKAAGYSVDEYTKLLKEEGVKIE
jgi:hypothetical protein